MVKALTVFFALLMSILSIACTSTPTANSQSSNVTNANPKDLPPGLNTQPIQPSANTTPGIPPANQVTNIAPGATPTPGIDPKNAVRTMKPGEKIPGIDPAAAKRQMNQPVDPSKLPPEFRNALKNTNSAPANTPQPTMMKKKPTQ